MSAPAPTHTHVTVRCHQQHTSPSSTPTHKYDLSAAVGVTDAAHARGDVGFPRAKNMKTLDSDSASYVKAQQICKNKLETMCAQEACTCLEIDRAISAAAAAAAAAADATKRDVNNE